MVLPRAKFIIKTLQNVYQKIQNGPGNYHNYLSFTTEQVVEIRNNRQNRESIVFSIKRIIIFNIYGYLDESSFYKNKNKDFRS